MTGHDAAQLPSLICLAGVSGSGKDTLAALFAARCGFTRVAIADPLKEWVGQIFGLEHEQLWGDERNRVIQHLDMTPRVLYQRFGAACVALDPEVLLRPWEQKVRALLASGARVICTDIRTPRELQAAKSLGAMTLLITRAGAGAPGDASKHATEQWARENEARFDLTHANNSAIDASFEALVDAIQRST